MSAGSRDFDVVVIGAGHAGVEAAWACANLGASVCLVTLDPSTMGVMSCNPAIGGIAKGQMVREIDALGGLMGRAADATGIMFKMLNTSRGPAVRSPRAQCDRHAYARCVQSLVAMRPEITVVRGAAERFEIGHAADATRRIEGVHVADRDTGGSFLVRTRAAVLTTGTFMRGLMHTGARRRPGGREGEAPANSMSETLRELGFELGRLKTGTPPRLRMGTIDWDALEAQEPDAEPVPFSDLTDRSRFPALEQVSCRITGTTEEIHELIRANLHRAPMFSGQITSAGPRYCPSIEDKVVRFADRSSHHVFLEPESHESDWVYCNGISTSLPVDVQERIVAMLPGCERAQIVQHGYAVEYDMVRPHQIAPTCMTKSVAGLFLAGQINATSGYEEAAGQGVVAGVNAVRFVREQPAFVLGRDEAYIGVMMDDLVTRTPREPYRMFTSRAEHRLVLRADNASDRLSPIADRLGLLGDERRRVFRSRVEQLESLRNTIRRTRVDGVDAARRVRAPGFGPADLASLIGETHPPEVVRTVLAEEQYAGYIVRQNAQIRRQASMERRAVPVDVDYTRIAGLRTEAAEVLARFRPTTFGQASRLEGVNPADLTVLMVALHRARA